MNTLQKTTMALVGIWAITAGSLAFAADTTPTTTDSGAAPQGFFNWGGGEKWGRGLGMMQQFFRTDLTDAEKTVLKDLQKTQRDEIKKFIDDNKDTLTSAETQAALKALQEKHITALLPYVAADKQAAFKTFQENMQPGKMMGNRGGRGNGGRGIVGGWFGAMIPKAISDKLDAKLTSMSDSAAKIAWLQNVNTKIDALAAKVNWQKAKRLLEEFKNLIGNKIDELSGNTIDENTLSKILD